MAALGHVHPIHLRLKMKVRVKKSCLCEERGQFDAMSSELLEGATKRSTGVELFGLRLKVKSDGEIRQTDGELMRKQVVDCQL